MYNKVICPMGGNSMYRLCSAFLSRWAFHCNDHWGGYSDCRSTIWVPVLSPMLSCLQVHMDQGQSDIPGARAHLGAQGTGATTSPDLCSGQPHHRKISHCPKDTASDRYLGPDGSGWSTCVILETSQWTRDHVLL